MTGCEALEQLRDHHGYELVKTNADTRGINDYLAEVGDDGPEVSVRPSVPDLDGPGAVRLVRAIDGHLSVGEVWATVYKPIQSAEAAEVLGVDPSTTRRVASEGKVEGARREPRPGSIHDTWVAVWPAWQQWHTNRRPAGRPAKWIQVADRKIRLESAARFVTDYSIGYTADGRAVLLDAAGRGFAFAPVGTRVLNRGEQYVWEVYGDNVGTDYTEWRSNHLGNFPGGDPGPLTGPEVLTWEWEEPEGGFKYKLDWRAHGPNYMRSEYYGEEAWRRACDLANIDHDATYDTPNAAEAALEAVTPHLDGPEAIICAVVRTPF